MKKLLTMILAAGMIAALTVTAWGSELPVNVEIAADAVMDGVTEEERGPIVDLLEMLPESGALEMLDGSFLQTDPDLAKGTISEMMGRRELSFTDGYIPKSEALNLERIPENVRLTRITKTPEFFEVSFSCTFAGVKTVYKSQIRIMDIDGMKQGALMKIWKDEEENVIVEAISEVFEDYYEEVIEPLY